ncbi:MAG: hypothetical protein ACTSR8_10960 [Promethearchaeota archaeon]
MTDDKDLKKKGLNVTLDTDWKKKEKRKKKDLKKEKYTITITKNRMIKFNHKTLGSYKFNFLKRNLLFGLLGMSLEDNEFESWLDQPEKILIKNVKELIKYNLVENIATMHRKRLRGDKRIHIYWKLTELGEKITILLLEWFNEQAKGPEPDISKPIF